MCNESMKLINGELQLINWFGEQVYIDIIYIHIYKKASTLNSFF